MRNLRSAAERGAALTRQLLAFSRHQLLEPAELDLNQILCGLDKMLRRLLGEDVDLALDLAPNLDAMRADRGHIEQVILNLAVNARDAMPRGGKLSIETRNDVRQESCTELPGGRYVTLVLTDTGCGMDEYTMGRMFEPFFTTKREGRGTGLGLSTCHGIVHQSGGTIGVASSPGKGTTFEIYFPALSAVAEGQPLITAGADGRGTETVLVIEDDDLVRSAVTRILATRGYDVLVARDGTEASALVEQHRDAIRLVLSDVIIPGTSGPEVVRALLRLCPDARALYMSGYIDHAGLEDSALHAGKNLLQKPFSSEALARIVRDTLDAR